MTQFLQTSGTRILDSLGKAVQLKGIGFGNEVWENDGIPYHHHSEDDFGRALQLGMNSVRFYLNYKTFENDAFPFNDIPEGWAWLDENVRWAKKHGIFLILNLHISHGGFQALGNGDLLWNEPAYQDRLVNFWKKLARRYENEGQIAGYSLMNKPVPGTMDQWLEMAQRLVKEIREVDARHIIFLEQAYYVKNENKESADLNFPYVDADNIVYEFQMYQPYDYTHQLLNWAKLGDRGSYPDDKIKHYLNETPGYDNSNEPKYSRNKSYLEASIKRYVDWSHKKRVPVYMSEFGTSVPTFRNGKGGLDWVRDVLSIADDFNLSYSYHAYHEDAYGLYFGSDQAPDPAKSNVELINLFKGRAK